MTVLDHRGGTLDDLLRAADTAGVDKLAARFRKSAMKAQPIKSVEVMMAALQIMGETAMEIIPDSDQRKAICMAMVGRAVEDLQ